MTDNEEKLLSDETFKPPKRQKLISGAIGNKRSCQMLDQEEDLAIMTGSAGDTTILTSQKASALEFCPLCQFPFKYLVGQTERWHLNDCFDRQPRTKSLDECPSGINCKSISQHHYRKYCHDLQAWNRSSGSSDQESQCKGKSKISRKSSKDDKSIAIADIQNSKSEFTTNRNESCCGKIEDEDVKNRMMETNTLDVNVSTESIELCCTDEFTEKNYKEIVSEIVETIESESTNISKSNQISNFVDSTFDKKYSSSEACDSVKDIAGTVHSSEVSKCSSNIRCLDDKINESNLLNSSVGKNCKSNTKFLMNGDGRKLHQINIGSYFGFKEENDHKYKLQNKEKVEDRWKNVMSRNDDKKISTKVENPVNAKGSFETDHQQTAKQQKRQCPFYKKIPGTPITVDAFSYGSIPGCTKYFLSHFHYDHYGGLKKSFSHDIYCSKVTAALVSLQIKVNPKYIHSLPLNEEINIDDTKVILLDANHCPGSVMFLFKLKNGKKFLHTGDFRAARQMAQYPALTRIDIDAVYLDTTYCNPKYNFPTQQETIDFATRISHNAVLAEPRTLIVCGTYSIGKERVFVAIANMLNCKICVKADKKRILKCLGWKDIDNRLTSDWEDSQVHVLPMNNVNVNALKKHLDGQRTFKKILAFKPTGWTFSQRITDVNNIRPKIVDSVSIYGIPYSEHSSFSELEWFVKHLKPKKIIPTVNVGSPQKRTEMQRIFHEWSSSKG